MEECTNAYVSGSSPRVRGKLQVQRLGDSRQGLIPACAGKTGGTASIAPKKWAHPRVCGENCHVFMHKDVRGGSSPRVRGKLQQLPEQLQEGGLIPACAGKTLTRTRYAPRYRAHPRVCGENLPNTLD